MNHLKKILSRVRSAIDKYDMISEGDRIAVGVSGGKDSLTTLYALAKLRDFYPLRFELEAVQIDLGFPGDTNDHEEVRRFCEELSVPYHLEKTDIAAVVFEYKKDPNPCSLCANMRRGALHNVAKKLGCNKLALGHHFDDAGETVMLNLLYSGHFGCFSPVTYLSRKKITVIRPMIHTEESLIRTFARVASLPVEESHCPVNHGTKREEIKEMLHRFDREKSRGVYRKLVTALEHSETDGWKP